MSSLKERVLNTATVVATLCAVTVAGIRVREMVSPRYDDPLHPQTVAGWQEYGATGVRVGPSGASVTIVEFFDFRCPYCRRAAKYLDRLRERYPDDIAIVYRHFPVHEFAQAAAVASECARRQGAFKAIYDSLFARPEAIGRDRWTSIAFSAGVRDTVRFGACMEDPNSKQVIASDSAAGRRLGVEGTPTFLINNLRLAGFLDDSAMDKWVGEALKRARR